MTEDYGEYEINIPMSEESKAAALEASNYIAALNLPKEQNDRMIALLVNHVSITRKDAFWRGFELGVKLGQESALDAPPLPHFVGDLEGGNDG